MPALAVLGVILLTLAAGMIFIGLCLGDRNDWTEDSRTVFWLLVVGVALLLYSRP